MDSTVMLASLVATVLRKHEHRAGLNLESRSNVMRKLKFQNVFIQSAEGQNAAAVCLSWLTPCSWSPDTVCCLDHLAEKDSVL